MRDARGTAEWHRKSIDNVPVANEADDEEFILCLITQKNKWNGAT